VDIGYLVTPVIYTVLQYMCDNSISKTWIGHPQSESWLSACMAFRVDIP